MKSTRLMLLVVSMFAATSGATLLADDGCCNSNNDCCTPTSALNNSCCCDCDLACCEDCNDCCTTGTNGTSSCNVCTGCAKSKDVLLPFSQSDNLARRYAGVAHLQNLADQEDWNWHFDVSVEYNQNFKRGLLGTYFFPNGTNRITVGEDTSISGSADVRGTDLGLSETFQGTLTICPKIQNAIFEPALYVGLDRWVEGLWFDIALPIAYTRWTLQACEITTSSGGLYFDPSNPGGAVGTLSLNNTYTISENSMRNAGTNGTVGVDPSNSVTADRGQVTLVGANSIAQAFGGSAVWGDKHAPLQAGRIPVNCPNNKTGVADLPFQLGYNFINQDRGYLGLYIRTVFPTGRIKNVRSMFNPIVGYDRFQLGGGLRAKARLWESDETSVNFFVDGYVTHIFSKDQCRVFDMKGRGAWSRYLLMKEADASGNYTGNLINFVDMFTACVNSSFPWQADVLAFFNVHHKGWTWDVGYEFKGRACEKFDCTCISLCSPCDDDNINCDESNDCGSCTGINNKIGNKQYGVKGPQFVGQIGELVRDAADTTINHFGVQTTPVATGGSAAQLQLINASNFLSYLDLETTRIPQAISNKVWSHLGYTWADRDYPVAAGLGFEVDFGAKNRQPRVWGVWGKVTVAYN